MNDKDIWKDYQSVWSRLDHLLPDNPYMAMPSADKPSPAGDSPKRPVVFRRLRWAVAAAVCGVLVAGGMLWWHDAEPPMAVPQPTEPLVASVSPTAYTVPQPTARRRVALSPTRASFSVTTSPSTSHLDVVEAVSDIWDDFHCNAGRCDADIYGDMVFVALIKDITSTNVV